MLAAHPLVHDLQTLIASPVVALAFIFAVGALGLYLLLPGDQPYSESAVRWFGGPLAVISLVLLAALVSVRVTWWPQIAEQESISRIAFAIPAALALVFAALAITSRRLSMSLLWFTGLLAMNMTLFTQSGANLVAFGNGFLAFCTLLCRRIWIVPLERSKRLVDEGRRQSGGEPALACFTGALLCVVLVAVITHATSGGDDVDHERLGRTMTRKREAMMDALAQQTPERESRPAFDKRVRAALVPFGRHPVALLASAALLVTALVGAFCIVTRRRDVDPFELPAEGPK